MDFDLKKTNFDYYYNYIINNQQNNNNKLLFNQQINKSENISLIV